MLVICVCACVVGSKAAAASSCPAPLAFIFELLFLVYALSAPASAMSKNLERIRNWGRIDQKRRQGFWMQEPEEWNKRREDGPFDVEI